MNYLEYLRQPHYLAVACAVFSAVLAFAEGKFSKQKYEYKYYLKGEYESFFKFAFVRNPLIRIFFSQISQNFSCQPI